MRIITVCQNKAESSKARSTSEIYKYHLPSTADMYDVFDRSKSISHTHTVVIKVCQ